jgi:hypothetical protein
MRGSSRTVRSGPPVGKRDGLDSPGCLPGLQSDQVRDGRLIVLTIS